MKPHISYGMIIDQVADETTYFLWDDQVAYETTYF